MLLVIDFRTVKTGTLVKRSRHWFKTRGNNPYERKQLGIIVDLKFFEDKLAGVVCYPVIRWEGSASDSMTHPANATLYRKTKTSPAMIKIEG